MGARKKLILLVLLITVVGSYATLQLVTERYEAQAQLLVKLGRENIEPPASVSRGMVTTMGVRQEEINSNVSLLQSRSLMEAVIDEVGPNAFKDTPSEPKTRFEKLKNDVKRSVKWCKTQVEEGLIAAKLQTRLSDREKAILYCSRALVVERVKNSDVIEIRLRLPDPALAVRVQETLLKRYLERHIEVRSGAATEDFFREQSDAHKSQLELIDRQIVELRETARISSIAKQRELLLAELSDLRQQMAESENELELLQASNGSGSEQNSGGTSRTVDPSPEMIPSHSVTGLKTRVVELHLERLRLSSTETIDTPRVVAINAEIAQLESRMGRGLKARIQQLAGRTAAIESRLEELNQREIDLDQLQRERMLAEQNYLAYVRRMEEDRISGALDRDRVANVAILAPPSVSDQPVFPKKKILAGVSVVVGLALGLGLALTLAYLDDRVNGEPDLAALEGLPVLGRIRVPRSACSLQIATPAVRGSQTSVARRAPASVSS